MKSFQKFLQKQFTPPLVLPSGPTESISLDELNRVLSSLTIKGTNWLLDKGNGVFMCSRPALRPIPKTWYHFIRTRLIPTTHVETVNKARLVLLHCIIEGMKVNVGQIIQREISAYSCKPKGCLFFPSLIYELCLKSGDDVNSRDDVNSSDELLLT